MAEFKQINATSAGKKDMEQVIQEAKEVLGMYQKKTILFIDLDHVYAGHFQSIGGNCHSRQ